MAYFPRRLVSRSMQWPVPLSLSPIACFPRSIRRRRRWPSSTRPSACRRARSADDILAVAKDADAILVTYAKITREIITQLTKCKAIGRFGLGVDNIDLAAAKEKGIAVNYVPDYCIREVSDHAMALLLALIRKIPLSNKLVQGGRWEMPAVVPIRRIEGTVLGLVGFGNIPRLVAPKAKAFGHEGDRLRSFRQAGACSRRPASKASISTRCSHARITFRCMRR